MIKKVIKPLWSFDVQKTERWLTEMAEKGYHFIQLNRHQRQFVFEKGSPKSTRYRISYDKHHATHLPKALTNDGWEKINESKHWTIFCNDKKAEEIKTTVVRDGIVKKNRILFYVYGGIFVYLVVILLNFLVHQVNMYRFPSAVREELQRIERDTGNEPLWFITYAGVIVAIGLASLSLYAMMKIKETNRWLNEEGGTPDDSEEFVAEGQPKFSLEEETQLKRHGKLIIRRKFIWIYAPDKLERWLGEMEEKGFNLYRVGYLGVQFYFLKGEPRKVSYCSEFQGLANETSAAMNREMGWKWAFSTRTGIQKWTFWYQEYAGEEKPQLYSEKTTLQKQAKKVVLNYGGIFLPLTVLFGYLLWNHLSMAQTNPNLDIHWFFTITITLAIIIYSFLTFRSYCYYLRLKKSYGNN
ncbi:MAG: DUF2812 domain-containing protein [Bacillus sp. (in: Bacteria)]|nr:DUF2812 domain-containing protein [Bacillus sp. (in: firmicutes)]